LLNSSLINKHQQRTSGTSKLAANNAAHRQKSSELL